MHAKVAIGTSRHVTCPSYKGITSTLCCRSSGRSLRWHPERSGHLFRTDLVPADDHNYDDADYRGFLVPAGSCDTPEIAKAHSGIDGCGVARAELQLVIVSGQDGRHRGRHRGAGNRHVISPTV